MRSIDSDLRMDSTAAKQATHLAAHLAQRGKAGLALLTRETVKLARAYIAVKPSRCVTLKLVGCAQMARLRGFKFSAKASGGVKYGGGLEPPS